MKFCWFIVSVLVYPIFIEGNPHLGILNGEGANIRDAPYAVALRYSGFGPHCSGSIIGDKWVLTSGDCAGATSYRDYWNLEIIFGTVDGKSKDPTQMRKVDKIYNAPEFSLHTLQNNIGIIKVDKTFDFSDDVKPVNLPNSKDLAIYGSKALVVGWGTYKPGVFPAPLLHKSEVTILEDKYCKTISEEFDSDYSICGQGNTTIVIARDDAGSGLVVKGTLYGMAYGLFSAPEHNVDLYIEVSTYSPFIKGVIGNNITS